MKDDDLHYLSANIMSSLKRLNISGFLNTLNDSGKLFYIVDDYYFNLLILENNFQM